MASKHLTTCFFWIIVENRGVNPVLLTNYRRTMGIEPRLYADSPEKLAINLMGLTSLNIFLSVY